MLRSSAGTLGVEYRKSSANKKVDFIKLYYDAKWILSHLSGSPHSDVTKSCPSRSSTAAIRCEGARCAYLDGMVKDLCPRSSFRVARSTPGITSWLAKVCRRSCNLKSLMPVILRADLKDLLMSLNRLPSPSAKT